MRKLGLVDRLFSLLLYFAADATLKAESERVYIREDGILALLQRLPEFVPPWHFV